jgi:hypothetical protein
MPEDGDARMDPHEYLNEVDEDSHEEDGEGGEVLELKAELLQEQEEEGRDWWHQPTGDVRVEEDDLPRDQVVEGARACPDLPGELRRGPPQKAAHRVELILALKAAGLMKRRHGCSCCGRVERIAKMQEEDETPGAKCRSQMCEWRRKGVAASGERKYEKIADPCGASL